jgi:DNA-binding HxlR family transcriptional regulator
VDGVTTRTYGQYCGVARALEMVGERWALLIIRDLLVGPKRYTDLRSGLPKIPTNVLATRLKELEQAGVVIRRVQPRPSGAVVYELTPYGAELEELVLGLGRWGARSLGELRPGEIATADSLIMALRSTFQPSEAAGLKVGYELRFGDVVVHARVEAGSLITGEGPLAAAAPAADVGANAEVDAAASADVGASAEADAAAGADVGAPADLVVEAMAPLSPLLSGELSAADVLANGIVRITGEPAELDRFAALFRIGPPPPLPLS